ncbi:MAG: cytochrome C [Sulfurimonas sp.]|nr:cytochrome C [Sulfurimonas sp.]MBU1216777.1 cytochrome C [bacterium]MBU1434904.1 cytochrome C [bacterium]MBU1504009.1 cytochrome C [bacterium]MBU3938642.1 cytochrome C [bacterium]
MKKTTSLLLAAMLAGSVFATGAMADAKQGQKYYLKKLKVCKKDGITNGGNFATKHDRDTWAEKKESGELLNAWKEICPSGESKFDKMKPDDITDLYDFCWQYASDGDVPSCG